MCDPAWGDHFISSRSCVSCRFCQNSFCHFYQPPCVPKEKFLVDMGEESPGIRVKFWNSLLLEIMAKLMKMREKADIEGEGVDVVLGSGLAISGLELQSFIFSEIFREVDWTDRFVWVCFWHRSTSAMWIFKSSYLISFWFAGIIWQPLIFSIS